jgi:DNA mismatch repair protein MutL
MAQKIKILPENLANKIAAGEVVQRPESVVKELMENSLDAGAKSVELIVKRAGKQLIQVYDDGSGMTEEDALLCIQKHATSKIFSYEDLEEIRTFGFRGEALSSIAAVSQLEIRTETRDEEVGTLIRVEEKEIKIEKGSFPKGTSVSVKNLFFNIPARRNFLKTDATELKHLIDTFNKIALSYPEVSFKFYNDDNLIFDYKQGTLEKRIKDVFADNMLDALVPVEEKTELFSLSGYIGKPTLLKKSKGAQYLFLNRRAVNSKQVSHAVFTAYDNILEKGDYPFFLLFLELDPKRVDVNVHPSKLEVRFDDEKDIYNFVLTVVRRSLGMFDLVPSVNFSGSNGSSERITFNPFVRTEESDFSDRPATRSGGTNNRERSFAKVNFSDDDIDLIFSALPDDVMPGKEAEAPFKEHEEVEVYHESNNKLFSERKDDITFIVQLHNKYILSQIKTGLMIIDQHVAHERILYEKALKRFDANMPCSQQLLFPKTLELDPGTYAVVKEIDRFLSKLGFEIKFFSRNTIVIEGVPDDVNQGVEEKILLEIVDEYIHNQREKKLDQKDNVAKSYSCHTSIRAGDKLSEQEMRLLIDQLFATSMPYVCPHGRPVVIKLSLEEFDKRFGRT